MKNIIAMIGSLRKDSVNRHVFNHYKEMTKDIFNMTEGKIDAIPFYNADITPEPQVITQLADAIRKADGIIFFSPEYNYSIPGVLKNAIDWLSRCKDQPFDNKKATIIGASPGNLGTTRMQYQLRQVGVFLNIYFMNRPEVMISDAYNKVKDGKIVDEGTVKFLKTHADAFNGFMK